ncbi:MAG: hypothetical protein AB7H80_17350, partial [Candidatus Kapaibacterium sp.]
FPTHSEIIISGDSDFWLMEVQWSWWNIWYFLKRLHSTENSDLERLEEIINALPTLMQAEDLCLPRRRSRSVVE